MIVIRVFDAVLDPTVGIIADRTTSRFGKFRPYILWGSIPYGVLGYVMFLNPQFTDGGKLVYAYVTYGLMWVAYTAINIPYSSLMGVMSPSSADRTSLSAYRFVCAFSATAIIGKCFEPLKKHLGHGNDAEGIRYAMLGFAIISVAMFLFTFFQTKERVHPPANQDKGLGKDLKNLVNNWPWVSLFFAAFFILVSAAVRNGSIIFYFKYAARNEEQLSDFILAGAISFIGGALLTKYVLRLGDRKKLIMGLYTLNSLLMIATFWVNPSSYALLLVINIVANLLAGPTPAILWSMYADVADFSEWKFRRRSTGLIFSGSVFSQKIGLAIGSGALAWLLGHYGFQANQVQGAASLNGIKFIFTVLPGVFGLLGAAAILFYPITDTYMKTIELELAERKAEPVAG